jgi:spermidine synthase
MLLPLAFLGAVVLAFEVFLTKLVSYTVDLMLIYVVVGVAMLGAGAAGSLVAVKTGWLTKERAPATLAESAVLFAASLILAPALYVRMAPHVPLTGPFGAFFLAGLLTLPFLTSGVTFTVALSAAGGRSIGRYYAANLVGSALGCFVPIALLSALGGERFMVLLAVLAAVTALLFMRAAKLPLVSSRAGKGLMATLALAALAFAFPKVVFPVVPEPFGQAMVAQLGGASRGIQTERLFERWDPTGHIAVFGYKVPGEPDPYPYRFYAQDGTAGSMLVRWNGEDETSDSRAEVPRLCTETIYAQGHARPREKVLVIGLGGAPDVQCALYHRAKSLDVVEINATTIFAMTGKFSDFLGGIGKHPNATFHTRDGRSFAHRNRGANYDLIQLSGVDTKQNMASGALALSENHLYTVEAFHDYFDALGPNGIVSIIRFGEGEMLRLMNTAVTALRLRGVTAPQDHLVAIENGPIIGVLVSPRPLAAEEIAAIRAQYDFVAHPFHGGVRPFFYELATPALGRPPVVGYAPGHDGTPTLARYMEAVARGDTDAFVRAYPQDITPTYDDRPFFFDLYAAGWQLPMQVLTYLLVTVTVFALVLILWPLAAQKKKLGAAAAPPWFVPLYFAAVGFAFLLVEVWLIHRFGMYLGHQTYGMVVVLAALLLGTGTGASMSERIAPDPGAAIRRGAAWILVVGVFALLALPPILSSTWGEGSIVRGGVAVVFVFAIGFGMGLPFPSGLRWLTAHAAPSVPWSIGINSFASVVASVGVIPVTMSLGYRAVLLSGLALYAVAFGLSFLMRASAAERARAAEPVLS